MNVIQGLCECCLGCNKLENKNFSGVYRCKDFVPAQLNWEQVYSEKLRSNNNG